MKMFLLMEKEKWDRTSLYMKWDWVSDHPEDSHNEAIYKHYCESRSGKFVAAVKDVEEAKAMCMLYNLGGV